MQTARTKNRTEKSYALRDYGICAEASAVSLNCTSLSCQHKKVSYIGYMYDVRQLIKTVSSENPNQGLKKKVWGLNLLLGVFFMKFKLKNTFLVERKGNQSLSIYVY